MRAAARRGRAGRVDDPIRPQRGRVKDIARQGDGAGKPVRAQRAAVLQSAVLLRADRHSRLDRVQFGHGGRRVRAAGVVAVHRDGDGRQDADDRDHDHQLDQGETLLDLLLHEIPPFVPSTAPRLPRFSDWRNEKPRRSGVVGASSRWASRHGPRAARKAQNVRE